MLVKRVLLDNLILFASLKQYYFTNLAFVSSDSV